MKQKKEKFIELLKSTNRDGIEDLINWLENESDFFEAPASAKYHSNYAGGLLNHSLNVCERLFELAKIDYKEDISKKDYQGTKSIILVSLLHDVCKANFYTTKYRNVKDSKGVWVKEPYYTYDDQFPMGHGEKSLSIIQRFIKLNDEEMLAIRWHMGGFEPKENYQYISKVFNQSMLALNLHLADLRATYIDEGEILCSDIKKEI